VTKDAEPELAAAGGNVDVAVIGGGLGGLCAAIAAAGRGLRVVVVRRGLGATAMSSGGLDFPDRLPSLFGREDAGIAPAEAASGIAPAEAAEILRGWCAAAGAELAGHPGQPLPLLDIAGHVRSTNLALVQHAAGRVDRWDGRRVLFLEVEGYAPFRAEWVKRMVVARGLAVEDRVTAGVVAVPGLEGEANLPAARIARALEEGDTAARFGLRVAKAARQAGAELVALPPVLGFERAAWVYETVMAAIAGAASGSAASRPAASGPAVTAFELLSPPPSLPGQRLQRLLDGAALAAGVEVVPGRVVGFGTATLATTVAAGAPAGAEASAGAEAPPPSVTSLEIASHGRIWVLEADEFVLAAGTFIAGGLRSVGQRVSEPLFGLSVFAPPPPGWPPGEIPVGDRPVREMVWERFDARHPIFEAGLAVDRDLRPLEASGRVSFANLRAAGSVIGGYNRFADGAGSGVAAVTGLAAGHLAAAAVERRRSG